MEEPPSETFERYALGLARREGLPGEKDRELGQARRQALLAELLRLGVKGWPERMTLYTRSLPSGCLPCLEGRGSNLCLTTLCNRECFFCFNPKPRCEGLSVHGRRVGSEAEIPGILEGLGVRSLGLSGGEPLLDPERVIRIASLVRERLEGLRVDLYTNGDLLTPELAARLCKAGVQALRLNLAAGGYRADPAELALRFFEDVEVEIPAVPEHRERVLRLMDRLAGIGLRHLVLHELFCSAQNLDALLRRGYEAKAGPGEALTWAPVAGSEETALELMLYSLRKDQRLSVYYCSCGTQEWIARRALERRAAGP